MSTVERTLPSPMLQVFDLPDMSQSFGARYVSTVPTPALQLMNDDFVLNQAQLFADRVKKEAGNDVAKQVDLACRIAVISIFNTGGVSQMETFEYKPAMESYSGQVLGGDVRVHDGRPCGELT